MSQAILEATINEMVQRHQALGHKIIYRTNVFEVLWYKYDIIGKALTREMMEAAARRFGGEYVNDNGRARIVLP